MKQSKYKGDLAAPMEPIYHGLLSGVGNSLEVAKEQRAAEIARRMNLLAMHFGLDPLEDPWFVLAYELAKLTVPGLAVRDPLVRSGAKKVWDHTRLSILVFEMNREIAGGLKIKQAAYKLAGRRPWKKLCKGDVDKGEAIRHRFTKARNLGSVKAGAEWWKLVSRPYFKNDDPEAWMESLYMLEEANLEFYV